MSADTPPFRILNGHIVASYFIFIRTSPRVDDEKLLQALGIDSVRHGWSSKKASEARVFITEDDAWILPIHDRAPSFTRGSIAACITSATTFKTTTAVEVSIRRAISTV